MFRGEHIGSGFDAGFQLQTHIVAQLGRFLENFHFLQHLLAAFGPLDGLLPVKALQLRDYFFLMPDLRLLVHPGLHLRIAQLPFLFGVSGIIAGKGHGVPVVDLDDF